MDETKNTLAIILKRQSYRENDSLVIVYTKKFGKLSLVARGTKKTQSKLAGHLEPISLAEIMIIKGKGHDYIGSALGKEAFLNIKDDLNKLYYAGQAIRIFNRLIKDSQADERLFYLLKNWLELINTVDVLDKERGELFLGFFVIRLLSELGYSPEMSNCLVCKQKITPGNNYFNLQSGGVVDKDCFQANNNLIKISDDTIKLIKFILNNKFNQSSKVKVNKKIIKELSSLTNNFLNYHL